MSDLQWVGVVILSILVLTFFLVGLMEAITLTARGKIEGASWVGLVVQLIAGLLLLIFG